MNRNKHYRWGTNYLDTMLEQTHDRTELHGYVRMMVSPAFRSIVSVQIPGVKQIFTRIDHIV